MLVHSMKVEVRKWKDAVYWMAAEVRMLMERVEIEGLELGAGTLHLCADNMVIALQNYVRGGKMSI